MPVKHISVLLKLSPFFLGVIKEFYKSVNYIIYDKVISQLPKLCVKISILMHRRMWVRSFSTRLTSVTFAEDILSLIHI